MTQQLNVILQKKRRSYFQYKKKINLNKKTLLERNSEREEHGIATEETNEIFSSQPVLDAKNNPLLSNLSEAEQPTQPKNEEKMLC